MYDGVTYDRNVTYYMLCLLFIILIIPSHLQHATPVISATRFGLIYFRWLNWHSITSLKFSVCAQLLLVRVPNGRHTTAAVALSTASDPLLIPFLTAPSFLCGSCCPPLPLPDNLFMHYYTGQVDLCASLCNCLLAYIDIVPCVRSSLIVAVFNKVCILED